MSFRNMHEGTVVGIRVETPAARACAKAIISKYRKQIRFYSYQPKLRRFTIAAYSETMATVILNEIIVALEERGEKCQI